MTIIWHNIKGYVAGAVAFITCPCHLPITLPLLIALTAGTAFSTWLANNILIVGGISTVIFIGGLVLAFRWIGETGLPGTSPGEIRLYGAKPRQTRAPLPPARLDRQR